MPKITFAKSPAASVKTAVIPVYKDGGLSPSAKSDKKLISHTIKNHPNFKGKLGQVLTITMADKSNFDHIVLLGLDNPKKLDALKAQEAGGKLYVSLKALGSGNAALIIEDDKALKKISTEELGANVAYGLSLRSYNYDIYKTKPKKPAPELKTFSIVNEKSSAIKKTYASLDSILQGVFTARDLVNAPPNDLYPESYAKFIQSELKPLGVSVEIIDEKKMAKLGMEAALAVGKGSERQPRMVVMQWKGAPKSSFVFVATSDPDRSDTVREKKPRRGRNAGP